jgi:hypothetical protein
VELSDRSGIGKPSLLSHKKSVFVFPLEAYCVEKLSFSDDRLGLSDLSSGFEPSFGG